MVGSAAPLPSAVPAPAGGLEGPPTRDGCVASGSLGSSRQSGAGRAPPITAVATWRTNLCEAR